MTVIPTRAGDRLATQVAETIAAVTGPARHEQCGVRSVKEIERHATVTAADVDQRLTDSESLPRCVVVVDLPVEVALRVVECLSDRVRCGEECEDEREGECLDRKSVV